jgi:hypothetical protein
VQREDARLPGYLLHSKLGNTRQSDSVTLFPAKTSLAIDKDFLNDYSKLEKAVQASVTAAFDKFAEHTHAGLHLEKLNQSKDDRLRTIRVDQFWAAPSSA